MALTLFQCDLVLQLQAQHAAQQLAQTARLVVGCHADSFCMACKALLTESSQTHSREPLCTSA